jgi:hypothetical protein
MSGVAKETKSCLTDRPIDKIEGDALKNIKKVDGLANFINRADTPITIGIQGGWGSGKTSLIKMLRIRLEGKGDDDADNDDSVTTSGNICLFINAWEHSLLQDRSSKCEVVVSLLRELLEEMHEAILDHTKNKKIPKEVLQHVSGEDGFLKKAGFMLTGFAAIAAKAAVHAGVGVLGQMVGNELGIVPGAMAAPENKGHMPVQQQQSAAKLVRGLRKYLKDTITIVHDESNYKRFVIFIDDLDRVPPEIAVEILDVIKNIFDLPHCIFVLAIDYDVVVKGLKDKFGEKNDDNAHEFRQYFDKIIQIPFHIPIANYELQMAAFLKACLIATLDCEFSAEDNIILDNMKNAAMAATDGIPRSIKRIINTMSLLQRTSENKQSNKDNEKLLNILEKRFIICALNINFPEISKKLMEKPRFTSWNVEELSEPWQLDDLNEANKAKITKSYNDTFDEDWEHVVYCLCQKNSWLKTRAVNISKLLNSLRIAMAGKKMDRNEKYMLDNIDAMDLRVALDTISVVSADSGKSENSIIENAQDKSKDEITNFFVSLHNALSKKITILSSPSPSSRAIKNEGDSDYILSIDDVIFGENIDFQWGLYWNKDYENLFTYVNIVPMRHGTKKIIRSEIKKNINNDKITKIAQDEYVYDIDDEFLLEKFTMEDPNNYVDAIVDFYTWFSGLPQKLKKAGSL